MDHQVIKLLIAIGDGDLIGGIFLVMLLAGIALCVLGIIFPAKTWRIAVLWLFSPCILTVTAILLIVDDKPLRSGLKEYFPKMMKALVQYTGRRRSH